MVTRVATYRFLPFFTRSFRRATADYATVQSGVFELGSSL